MCCRVWYHRIIVEPWQVLKIFTKWLIHTDSTWHCMINAMSYHMRVLIPRVNISMGTGVYIPHIWPGFITIWVTIGAWKCTNMACMISLGHAGCPYVFNDFHSIFRPDTMVFHSWLSNQSTFGHATRLQISERPKSIVKIRKTALQFKYELQIKKLIELYHDQLCECIQYQG